MWLSVVVGSSVITGDICAHVFSSFSVKCAQKTVKDAYHIICKPCSLQLEICCKCGKKEDIVIPWVGLYSERACLFVCADSYIQRIKTKGMQHFINPSWGNSVFTFHSAHNVGLKYTQKHALDLMYRHRQRTKRLLTMISFCALILHKLSTFWRNAGHVFFFIWRQNQMFLYGPALSSRYSKFYCKSAILWTLSYIITDCGNLLVHCHSRTNCSHSTFWHQFIPIYHLIYFFGCSMTL